MNVLTRRRCACLNRNGTRCHREGVQSWTLSTGQEISVCKLHFRLFRDGLVPPRVSVAALKPLSDADNQLFAPPSRAKERPAVSPAPVVKVRSRTWAQVDWCGVV